MGEDSNKVSNKQILFCNCSGDRIPAEILSGIDKHLKDLSVDVTKVSDLCGIVAKKPESLLGIFNPGNQLMVIGCYKRTMSLLIDQILDKKSENYTFNHINLIETELNDAITQLRLFSENEQGKNHFQEIKEDSGWPSWYPVIDYARCTSCGQCSDFCLFGVYENDGNRVKVVNPEGCKNNCPACGRICPATAIIFPKYKHGGAIGGSEDINEQAELQRQAQDIESILGNDIYAAMEKRKAKRQSIIRQEALKKALDERNSALNNKQ